MHPICTQPAHEIKKAGQIPANLSILLVAGAGFEPTTFGL
jgi:hypothetical protein